MFNQFGDLERCSLRPGNVHSADGWDGVLKPVVERYQGKVSRIYFRADAGFANPEVYECLEAERIKYAIRLPANRILQERIGHLLTRPIGRPPNEVRRSYANFTYQAGSWTKSRRVVAKVEWHPGELYPRVGFIVTNMSRPARARRCFLQQARNMRAMDQGRQGRDQMDAAVMSDVRRERRAVCLQLHALAYNLGNFLRTLATPEPIKDWSLTSLKEKLIKIGAKVVSHGRYVASSRWPRSPCTECHSPTFCGSSRNFDRRQSHQPRKAFIRYASEPNSRERCASMTESSAIFNARHGGGSFHPHRQPAPTAQDCLKRGTGANGERPGSYLVNVG